MDIKQLACIIMVLTSTMGYIIRMSGRTNSNDSMKYHSSLFAFVMIIYYFAGVIDGALGYD